MPSAAKSLVASVNSVDMRTRSLQKVQGHRTAQGHGAGVDVDVTPPTGGPVGHPPNPATLCDRIAEGSKSWHSGSFAKYSDIGLVTISFPACCVSHRATGLPVMVLDMHTRRRRPDYLQACPTGPPVDGVKSALTPAAPVALCGPVALYLLQWPCGRIASPIWSIVHEVFVLILLLPSIRIQCTVFCPGDT